MSLFRKAHVGDATLEAAKKISEEGQTRMELTPHEVDLLDDFKSTIVASMADTDVEVVKAQFQDPTQLDAEATLDWIRLKQAEKAKVKDRHSASALQSRLSSHCH